MLGRAERLWFLTWVLAEEDEEDGEQGIFRPQEVNSSVSLQQLQKSQYSSVQKKKKIYVIALQISDQCMGLFLSLFLEVHLGGRGHNKYFRCTTCPNEQRGIVVRGKEEDEASRFTYISINFTQQVYLQLGTYGVERTSGIISKMSNYVQYN